MKYYETKIESNLKINEIDSLIRKYGFLGWRLSSVINTKDNNIIIFQKEIIINEPVELVLRSIIKFLSLDSSTVTELIIISEFRYYSSVMLDENKQLDSLIGSFLSSLDEVIDLDQYGKCSVGDNNKCTMIHKDLKTKYFDNFNKFFK